MFSLTLLREQIGQADFFMRILPDLLIFALL